ncbi:MAG: ECF transporter S component, partial [Clostridia bacterium]|nr:ECF transporter S component [Clostridia bacterium]
MNNNINGQTKTVRLAKMGMLVAISIVLVYFIHIPMFTAFYEYDPADIPILIGTFAFGPWAGLMLTVVTSVVQGLTVSAASGVYGI